MRVGVLVGCGAMGRPAGMPNADRAMRVLAIEQRSEVVDASGRFRDGKLASLDRDNARAIVAAVFEPSQPGEQKISCWLRADVTDNAAHNPSFARLDFS